MRELPTVYVVEDDASLRRALERLLDAKGYRVSTFATAEAFLNERLSEPIACLVLDLQLPGLSGLDLQNALLRRDIFLPIIFISGHGTIPSAIRAVKLGAVGFLTKPFSQEQLILEIDNALAVSRNETARRSELASLRQRFERLTKRESEIFQFVTSGKLNKQTASDLGIVINTVKVHRRRVMKKMQAESLADLVVMAQKLHVTDQPPPNVQPPELGAPVDQISYPPRPDNPGVFCW
jgi:FixJ family two-component response regulator